MVDRSYIRKCAVCGKTFRARAHNACLCSRDCKLKRDGRKTHKQKAKQITPFDWEYGRYARR